MNNIRGLRRPAYNEIFGGHHTKVMLRVEENKSMAIVYYISNRDRRQTYGLTMQEAYHMGIIQ